MKYSVIPSTTFQNIQLGAGVLAADFDTSSGTLESADILGATSGGNTFAAVPSFIDYGEDIDNCPKNMKELKKLDSWEVTLTGTFVTLNTDLAKKLIAAADVSDNKVTPRNDLAESDFSDIWFVGDYSDKNGPTKGGFIAIHMMNALSTGGFRVQSADSAKGQFTFEFTAHYSIDAQDTVPFEVYVKAGEAEG